MNTQITSVTYSSDASEFPSEEYWLRIEQDKEEDLITVGEVAEVLDALYDLNPCYGEPTNSEAEPSEPPTEEKLVEVAKVQLDLEECRRLKSGMYTALVNIYRSHPNEPYVLYVDVGAIKSTITVTKEIVVQVTINGISSLKLDFPIKSNLSASWIGSVYNNSGLISPPIIKEIYGNTLFWEKPVTGFLRAEFVTVHDIVEIEVPGIPKYVGSEFGNPQDVNLLAFYHYQFYEGTVTAPTEDILADKELLAQVCGWESGQTTDPEEPEEPEIPEQEPEFYGCVEEGTGPYGALPLAEPSFYLEKCCVAGIPNPCRTWKSPNPGGYVLPQETMDRMTREWDGPIEFISVGPITSEGCGAIYTEQIVRAKNCCDEVEPIVWDFDNSSETIAPGYSALIIVTGGISPYSWSVRGQGISFNQAGNIREITTLTPYVYVYASLDACGFAPVTVTDGCSIISNGIRVTLGQWIRRPDLDNTCPGSTGELTQYDGAELYAGKLKYVQTYLQGNVSGGGVGTCDTIRNQFYTIACDSYNPNAPFCITLNLPKNPLCPDKMYIEEDTLHVDGSGCSGDIRYRYPFKSNPSTGVYVDTMVYEWVCP